MALVRWDPARELASMEVDRLNNMFSNFYGEGFARSWVPPVDIYETPQHEVVIKAELPGDEAGRHQRDVRKQRAHHQGRAQARERGRLATASSGSSGSTAASAARSRSRRRSMRPRSAPSYKDGVLTVRLPQREEAKPKQITVGE